MTVNSVCYVDANITHSPHKHKTKPTGEIVNDREKRDDEPNAQAEMEVIEATQLGVDDEDDSGQCGECYQVSLSTDG